MEPSTKEENGQIWEVVEKSLSTEKGLKIVIL